MINSRHSISLFFFLVYLVFCVAPVSAQDMVSIRAKVHIKQKQLDGKGGIAYKDVPDEPVYYGFFRDQTTTENAAKELEKKGKLSELPKKYRDFTHESYVDGTIEDLVFLNGWMFVMSWDFNKYEVFQIVPNKTEYVAELKVDRSNVFDFKGDVKPVSRTGGTLRPKKPNGTDYFPILIERPDTGYIHGSTRFVIQTFAVDCMTEDTIALCQPIVFESSDYHIHQDKRKKFDFYRKDDLSIGYDSLYVLIPNQSLKIDTGIYFKRPKGLEDHHFKGPFKYFMEDYHHLIDSGGWQGTCLERDPWKFLDFSRAYGYIKLDREEFYEEPRVQVNNVTKQIDLHFIKGKSVLLDNEENDSIKRDLLNTMRSFDIVNPKIKAYSSPEGGYKVNYDLAKGRADAGNRLLSIRNTPEYEVSTWRDLANVLEESSHFDEAKVVNETLAGITSSDSLYSPLVYNALKKLPTYDDVVEPALARLRKMEFSFGYIESRPMLPAEVVRHYYKNKRYILSGDSVCRYSNGDFFNLYHEIHDADEQDTITMMAYNKLRSIPKFETQKFAPYVVNRMALLKLKQNKPDSLLLKNLINIGDPRIGYKQSPTLTSNYTITMNRKEIVQNQALTYFLMNNITQADTLLTWLKESGQAGPEVQSFLHYVTLINGQGDAEKEATDDYRNAKDFVLRSDRNKAILYTELPEWGMKEAAKKKWIDLLDDSDPVKWYLKGLIWSNEPCVEKNRSDILQSVSTFKPLPTEVLDSLKENDEDAYLDYLSQKENFEKEEALDKRDIDINISNIPFYLAYFQQCFDIDDSKNKKFKRLYFDEGLVTDDIRKKYPYSPTDINAYRKLFRILKRNDDKNRMNLLKKEDSIN